LSRTITLGGRGATVLVTCGFLVLEAGVTRSPSDIEKEIVVLVREKLRPVAAFKLAITVGQLPKTRSGKILRGTIKKIADGDPWDHAGNHRGSRGAG
jgi:propionyl-CoA synthetase